MYILGYADGVKGYRLWCSEPKSPKFIISKDVFDESAMFYLRKESIVFARKEKGSSNEVELQVEASQMVQDNTQDQPVIDVHDSSFNDDDP